MKNLYLTLALALSFFSTAINAQEAAAEKKPYSLVVWADLTFDDNSQLSKIEIQDKEALPKAFVNYLMTSLASISYAPPEKADSLKQFSTGLKVIVEIDPVSSKAKFLSVDMMPRPVKTEHQAEPILRVKGDWNGRILVTCLISNMGRCTKPKIDQSTNAPDQLPKVLLNTMGPWRFVPQTRAGKAVEGEFTTWMTIEGDTSQPRKLTGKSI